MVKDGCLSSRSKKEFALLHLCVVFGPSINWMMPTHTGEGDCHLLYWFKYQFLQETHILRNNVYQLSGHPLAQLSWYIKLTITSLLLVNLAAICPSLNHTWSSNYNNNKVTLLLNIYIYSAYNPKHANPFTRREEVKLLSSYSSNFLSLKYYDVIILKYW